MFSRVTASAGRGQGHRSCRAGRRRLLQNSHRGPGFVGRLRSRHCKRGRRARRCHDVAGARYELRAPVTDEVPELPALVPEVGDEVARHLRAPNFSVVLHRRTVERARRGRGASGWSARARRPTTGSCAGRGAAGQHRGQALRALRAGGARRRAQHAPAVRGSARRRRAAAVDASRRPAPGIPCRQLRLRARHGRGTGP
jgi:hypothetical protein